jgi:hypothetical protein
MVPTLANSFNQRGPAGTGTYTSSFDKFSFTPNTTYYVRAYATNAAGTAYGGVVSFTTAAAAPNNPATVTTDSVRQITVNSATAYGNITSIGNSTVTQYGHVYSSTNNVPTLNDSKTQLGTASGPLKFTSSLSGLTAGTLYYVRSYAINNGGTSYGDVITFTTTANTTPTVTTGNPFVGTSTIDIPGTITSTGNTPVTQHGHVYSSTNMVPTLANSFNQRGPAGTGTYTSSFDKFSFTPNTTYYVRAYATNAAGTAYGGVVSFTTAAAAPNNPATVTTDSVRQITVNSATAYGNITSIGNSTVTQYGHVYSNSNTIPTINDSKTQLGTASGPLKYTSSLTGLTAGTLYYVRSYAINNGGISYGAVLTFTTTSPLPTVTTGDPMIGTSTIDIPGTITSIGSSPVTEHGHIYSSANTIPSFNSRADTFNQLGPAGTGTYISSFNKFSFQFNTTYYVRAYATNAAGTGYGEVKTFILIP